MCVCVCVCACACACACACMCACACACVCEFATCQQVWCVRVRAVVGACVRAFERACVLVFVS